MSHFEIEVKSLLGEEPNAIALKESMFALDPDCALVSTNKQLNHYFEGGDVQELFEKTKHLFTEDEQEKLLKTIERGTEYSIRTRQRDDEILLVVKASIDDRSSAHTIKRIEFEEPVTISLDALDEILLSAGFDYLAKWSREREEYAYKGASVCLDKNAGYGYVAEFEKIVPDENMADAVRAELDELMAELGVVELSQDRLDKMFAHYNANWPDYYGTEKVFIIE